MTVRHVPSFQEWVANGAEPTVTTQDRVEVMRQTGQAPAFDTPEGAHPIWRQHTMSDFARSLAQRENLIPTLEELGQQRAALIGALERLQAGFDATKAVRQTGPVATRDIPRGLPQELEDINRLKARLVHLDAFISGIQDPRQLQAWVDGMEYSASLPADAAELNMVTHLERIPDPHAIAVRRGAQLNYATPKDLVQTPDGPDFAAAVFNSWARSVMAVRALPELKGFEVPQSAADSQAVGLAAMGWVETPEDPVLNMLTHVTRSQFARDHPVMFDLIRRGVKYGDEKPLRSFAAEVVAFAPIAVVEAAATHGAITAAGLTGGRALLADVAVNSALAAFEGYAMTPGPEENRQLGLVLGGTLGAGLTAGLGGAGVWAKRFAARRAAEAAAPGPEGIQLSKFLRAAPDLLTAGDEPMARRIVAAVEADLVDAGDLASLWRELGHTAPREATPETRLGKLAQHVDRILKDATEDVQRPWDGETPSTFFAQARNRAVRAADHLTEAYLDRPMGQAEARRLARDVERSGGTAADILAVTRGSSDEGFGPALRRYATVISEEVAQDIETKVAKAAKGTDVTSGDLDHAANRLHQLVFEARMRGMDLDWDWKLLPRMVQDITEDMRAAHPDLPAEGQQRLAGAVSASGKRGIPDFARPMFRFAIDLFADPRPGRLAATNLHEMAHIWAVMLESLRPEQYKQLAGEVAESFARHTKGVVADELDPRRVGELFAQLLTNHTLLNEMTTTGETFLVKMSQQFGHRMQRLFNRVLEWRSKYWVPHVEKKAGRAVQVMGDVRQPWSKELLHTARQFTRGNWRGILDDLAGITTPADRADVRVSFGPSYYEVLRADDIDDLIEDSVRRRLTLEAELDVARQARSAMDDKLTAPKDKSAATRAVSDLRRQLDQAKATEARLMKDRPAVPRGVNDAPSTPYEFQGLEGLPVRLKADVRPQVFSPISRIDFDAVMTALRGGKQTVWTVDGEAWDLTRAVRYLAEWYDRGRQGAGELLENMRALGKELDPGNPYWDQLDLRKVIGMLGVTAARKGPWNNLQAAVRAIAYNAKNPGGHYVALDGGVFRMTNIVRQHGSLSDAPAEDVLKDLASNGAVGAAKVLDMRDAKGFPRPGQTWAEWLMTTDINEFHGRLKLISYERNLAGDRVLSTHDMWDLRFFLNNMPDRHGVMLGIAEEGGLDRYRQYMLAAREADSAARERGKAASRRATQLTAELAHARTVKQRTQLEKEIAEQEAVKKAASVGGSRVRNLETGKWDDFSAPNQSEYLLMSDIYTRMAEAMNAGEPEAYWSPERVQAAVWGLMRGDLAEDAPPGLDFLNITRSWVDGKEAGTLRAEIAAAVDAGKKDTSDVFTRTNQGGTHPFGDTHPLNLLRVSTIKRAGRKLGQAASRFEGIVKAIANSISISGDYSKSVAKLLGAKKTQTGVGTGTWKAVDDAKATIEFNATISSQTPRGQRTPLAMVGKTGAARIGHMVSGLNMQQALEFAELPGPLHPLVPLTRDNVNAMNQVIIRWPGSNSLESSHRTWLQFWDEIATRTGLDKAQLIEGAAVGVRGGTGELRISIGRGYGIGEPDAFWAHVPDVVDEMGGELNGTTARSSYYDAELDLGGLNSDDPWHARWMGLQRALGEHRESGNTGEVEGTLARIGELVAARHLFHALEGLDKPTRTTLLDHYALANRSLLTELIAHFNNPLVGDAAADNVVTEQAILEMTRIADGSVLRLLNDIVGDGDVIDRAMIDELSVKAQRWIGKAKLPKLARPYLNSSITRQGSVSGIGTQQGVKVGMEPIQVGVDSQGKPKFIAGKKETRLYDVLEPEDEIEIAEAGLAHDAANREALGDPETAEVLRQASDFSHDSLRYAANIAGEDANALDAVAAMQMGGHLAALAKAGLHIARRGYRNHFKDLFEPVGQLNRRVANLFNQVMAADVQARQASRRISDYVLKDMTLDEKKMFQRFLQSEKAKVALKRAGGELGAIGRGMRKLLMPEDLEQRTLANPRIKEALRRHRERAMPEMIALLKAIDPDNAKHLLDTEWGYFMPSMRFDRAIHRPDISTMTVVAGPERSTKQGLGSAVSGGSTRSMASRFHVEKKAAGMQGFTGKGTEYVTDYEELLTWRLNRNTALAEQRRLLTALQEEGLTRPTRLVDENGNVVPAPMPTDMVNGKEVRWRRIRVRDRPSWVRLADEATGEETTQLVPTGHEEMWVPDTVAGAWEYVKTSGGKTLEFGRSLDGRKNAWYRFADFTTAAMLATVAEASRHSLRVLAMAVRVPQASLGGADVGAMLIPYFGPRGRMLYKMATAYDHPDALHLEKWMARVGALPERAFDETHVPFKDINPDDSLPKRLGKKGANTAIGSVHAGRGFLFDLPDVEARGWRLPFTKEGGGPLGVPVPARLWGFDVRARVVASRTFFEHLKATGRIGDDVTVEQLSKGETTFDADLREFLLQFGMFNGRLQTRIVQKVKALRINPFAGSQGGFRPAEIETLFGLHRLPKEGMTPMMKSWYGAQVIYGGWLGYMTALMISNKALSGHWPWENEDGHEFDLQVGTDTDGSPIYLSANFIEPAFSRAMRTTGLRYIFDERFGYEVKERIPKAMVAKGANEILGFFAGGPPVQGATVALTGRAPYISDGKLLQVAPPQARALPRLVRDAEGTHLVKGKVLQNLITAGVNINHYIAQMNADEVQTAKHVQDPRWKWTFEAAHLIFGKVGSVGQPPVVSAGQLARKENQTMDKLVWYYWQKMQSAHGAEDRQGIQLELLRQLEPNQRNKALLMLNQLDISMPKAQQRRAIESQILRGQRQ